LTSPAIVWDQKSDPPVGMGEVLCWQSYAEGDQISSVPRHLENHSERLKNKYLAFIYDLGESKISGKRVIDHLSMDADFSFWWMTLLAEKSPYKSPRIYDCLRILALEEILLERKLSNLILKSYNRDLAQAIRLLCRDIGVNFSWKPESQPPQKWSLRRLYRAMPYPVRGLLFFARHLVTRWLLRNLKSPNWFSGKGSIFLCSFFSHLDPTSCEKGNFYSRQWEMLPKHIHDSGRRTNWLQHFLPSSVLPNVRMGISWLRSFNLDSEKQGCHSFLDTYLTLNLVGRVLKSWFSLNVLAWRLRNIKSVFYPKGSSACLWPILQDDWLASLSGPTGVNNCLWVELFDAALNDIPHQEMGFYLYEKQGWENALLHAWRKHGHGKIIGVQHATVPFWHLYYFDDPRILHSEQNHSMPLPDHIAVNGPMAWDALSKTGYSAEQLVEVEALRYLNLSRVIAKPALGSKNYDNMEKSVPASPRYEVLILGDIDPTSMDNFLRLLENTMELLSSAYKFTFRPHPAYAVHLGKYPGLQAEETTGNLHRVLADFDVVLTTSGTSAALDTYLAGLPVIIYLNGSEFNLSPLRGHSGVGFVSTSEELAEALQMTKQYMVDVQGGEQFFFLDPELPRWNKLLQMNLNWSKI
jgi:surface carbohydrate biosynthesis protein (TIGR04326 family)